MTRTNLIAASLGATALIFAASPTLAQGKADRARSAIAEAHGKIDAANKVGVAGDAPRMQAEAQAALRTAEEELARGQKEAAITDAHRASQLADTALGEAQRNRNMQANAQQAEAQAATAEAQQQAHAANERADAAQQAAASAAADAAAARAAPPVVVAAPTPTTTVTTETVKQQASSSAPTVRRRVVRKSTAPKSSTVEKTTTSVTTSQN